MNINSYTFDRNNSQAHHQILMEKNPVPFQGHRIALKISGMKKQGIIYV
jgi:hypothetical protein